MAVALKHCLELTFAYVYCSIGRQWLCKPSTAPGWDGSKGTSHWIQSKFSRLLGGYSQSIHGNYQDIREYSKSIILAADIFIFLFISFDSTHQFPFYLYRWNVSCILISRTCPSAPSVPMSLLLQNSLTKQTRFSKKVLWGLRGKNNHNKELIPSCLICKHKKCRISAPLFYLLFQIWFNHISVWVLNQKIWNIEMQKVLLG